MPSAGSAPVTDELHPVACGGFGATSQRPDESQVTGATQSLFDAHAALHAPPPHVYGEQSFLLPPGSVTV
jgi:hypothetical protein